MQIIIDVQNEKAKQFIDFLKTLDYVKFEQINKKNNFKKFAGKWKNKDISLETIREKAWKK